MMGAAEGKGSTMTMTTMIADDIEPECPACGEPRREYTCRRCGVSAQLINCGHYHQPRPISGLTGETLCDACWKHSVELYIAEEELYERRQIG